MLSLQTIEHKVQAFDLIHRFLLIFNWSSGKYKIKNGRGEKDLGHVNDFFLIVEIFIPEPSNQRLLRICPVELVLEPYQICFYVYIVGHAMKYF